MTSIWDYEEHGSYGPKHWGKRFPLAAGNCQSPIDIKDTYARFDDRLAKSKFQFNYLPDDLVKLKNTGESFQLALRDGGSRSTLQFPGYLPDMYKVLQAHFHWGTNARNGSEHTLNGVGYAAELHVVHMSSKYKEFGEALKNRDGLAVVGVFLEESQNVNSEMERICDLLKKIPFKGDVIQVEKGFDLNLLLPDATSDFYAYDGSLTTPPCCECVLWSVFRQPITITPKQLKAMRNLYAVSANELDRNPHCIDRNARPVQAVNGRTVRASVRIT